MKKIICLDVYKIIMVSLGLAIVLPLAAADTGQINYQARLLDSYGRRVNDTVDLSFKIYDAVTAGNLLWSETQAGVVVQDGVYSVVLGSQTAIPASVFTQNSIYLELGIDGETMSPRQQITAAAYSLVARTVMGSNIFENQTSGYVGVGTTNPAVKLDVSGTVQATGIKMPTGATANYILVSDASGVGTWQSVSMVVTNIQEATNSLNTAINNEIVVRGNADTGISNAYIAADTVVSNGLNNRITAEATARIDADTGISNTFNTAVGLRMFRAGDTMTGPLTNEVAYYGNGIGLTNIPSGGVSLTGVVHRIGGLGNEMTGPLVISNSLTVTSNVTVSGNATWRPGVQTIVDGTSTIEVNQVYVKIGTGDGALKDLSGCNKQIAPGFSGQMLIIQATNGWIQLTNGCGVALANGVSFSMSTNDTMQLIYDGSTWVELQRADNNLLNPTD